MILSKKIKLAAIFGAILILLPAGYLMTSGHYFLPLPEHSDFKGEKIETWEFSNFVIPMEITPWYRLKYPARVRMIEIDQTHTKDSLQEIFEELGYTFPPGCSTHPGG